MRRFGFLSAIVLTGLTFLPGPSTGPALSDSDACPEIVTFALEATGQMCDDTGRNQACYGHILVDARVHPDAASFRFDQAGDRVGLTDLQSLRLSEMDTVSGMWGVALLRLQADLSSAVPEKNVTLLVFGDVDIENAASDVALQDMTVQVASNVNVREQPDLGAAIVGRLAPGQTVTATGRLEDSSWVRVLLPEGNSGWVDSSLLKGGIPALDAVEASAPYFGPMQAFYLESGMDDALCPEAPDSGILVQTPEGVAEVTLLVNEVDIQLGATAYFQAQAGDNMAVRVVEGRARVTAQGVTQTAYAGTEIKIPLDANGRPAGPPTPPVGYEMGAVSALPVDRLERTVAVHPSLTADEIATLAAEEDNAASTTASPGATTLPFYETVGGENPDQTQADGPSMDQPDDTGPVESPPVDQVDENQENTDLPPGLIDNPGLGDSVPPGHGGSPPGLDDKDKKDKKDK
jgi:hypothetical protein